MKFHRPLWIVVLLTVRLLSPLWAAEPANVEWHGSVAALGVRQRADSLDAFSIGLAGALDFRAHLGSRYLLRLELREPFTESDTWPFGLCYVEYRSQAEDPRWTWTLGLFETPFGLEHNDYWRNTFATPARLTTENTPQGLGLMARTQMTPGVALHTFLQPIGPIDPREGGWSGGGTLSLGSSDRLLARLGGVAWPPYHKSWLNLDVIWKPLPAWTFAGEALWRRAGGEFLYPASFVEINGHFYVGTYGTLENENRHGFLVQSTLDLGPRVQLAARYDTWLIERKPWNPLIPTNFAAVTVSATLRPNDHWRLTLEGRGEDHIQELYSVMGRERWDRGGEVVALAAYAFH